MQPDWFEPTNFQEFLPWASHSYPKRSPSSVQHHFGFNSRIFGWKAKILSQAAKATLIKSVISSMPSYWMSSFKLPKSICSKTDATLRDFSGDLLIQVTISIQKHGILYANQNLLGGWASIMLMTSTMLSYPNLGGLLHLVQTNLGPTSSNPNTFMVIPS